MTVPELLRETLLPLGYPVHPDGYDGPDRIYWVYTVSTYGAAWGDNAPDSERCYILVQLYGPLDWNPNQTLRAAQRRLLDAGFTWPSRPTGGIEDGTYRHYPLQCEYLEQIGEAE